MKKIFLLLLSFTIVKTSLATEWAWYYIYVQKEYIQGPWIRADVFAGRDNYAYLHPQQFEELFGSEPGQLAHSIFSHLREETPERYGFRATVAVAGDTVIVQTQDAIKEFDAVKNELTASFVLNNFRAVKIIQPGKVSLYGFGDLTVPYMDLVVPAQGPPIPKTENIRNEEPAPDPATGEPIPGKTGKKWSVWVILSLLLNSVLAILLLRKRN